MPSAPGELRQQIVEACRAEDVPVKTLPGLHELIAGDLNLAGQIRPVQVEDVLGREQVEVDLGPSPRTSGTRPCSSRAPAARSARSSAASSRGSARRGSCSSTRASRRSTRSSASSSTSATSPPRSRCSPTAATARRCARSSSATGRRSSSTPPRTSTCRCSRRTRSQAVANNVLATRAIAEVAVEFGVERFVLISTDKAANPKNLLGQSKAVCEWIVESFALRDDVATRFVAVRFGNVLGSSGLGDPDLPPPDRARRPGDGDEPGDDALLHDDPRGVVARRPGRRDGRARPGLRARHGRAGQDPRPRAADDPALRPGPRTEIPIVFVGARAGEKLHEELWNDGEAVGPTSHPKIMRAARPPIDAAWLEERLAELERLVAEGDTLGVVAKLRAMVARAAAHRPRSGARRHAALAPRLEDDWFALNRFDSSRLRGHRPRRARRYRGRVDPLDGLNPEQRRAAEAVRGPVCILAGAGSGKTTTITRRIAQQVATGAFAAGRRSWR